MRSCTQEKETKGNHQVRHPRILRMPLLGLAIVSSMAAAGAKDLTFEALPVSAGAVELRWNEAVDAMIERQKKGGAFEAVRRSGGNSGTLGNVPMRRYFDRGLTEDTEYTYRLVVPNGWHYDFGPKALAAAPDHMRVDLPALYSDETGFGFERPGGEVRAVGHEPRPPEYTFVAGAGPFIQRLPKGRYRVTIRGPKLGRVFLNGTEVETKNLGWSDMRSLDSFMFEATEPRLVVDTRGAPLSFLNIVPDAEPVKVLAEATVRTPSVRQMTALVRDTSKPMADRLAALYSLGDMRAAAKEAAPEIAEVLLATETDKGPMHWLAVWSLWKIGPEHVAAGQRADVERALGRFANYDRALLPAAARALIQEAGPDRSLFGQFQMILTAGPPGEKMPPRVSDAAFFGRWDAARGAWAVPPVVQYDFSPDLGETLAAAKRGDYEAAKKNLLAYYRGRSLIPRPDFGSPGETIAGEAALRSVSGITALGAFTVGDDWSWHTIELPTATAAVACLVSDWERAGLVGIRSRESKGFAPRLEIITDNDTYVLEAKEDTTVRAGAHAKENFGTNETLLVQEGPIPEGPNPATDETMRAYLSFDVPPRITTGIEPIRSQRLYLYAKTLGDRKNVSLGVFGLRPSTIQGREQSLTWGNHTTPLFIYKDIEFDWFRPPGAERQAKYWYPRGAFGDGGMYARTGNEQHAYNTLFNSLDFSTKQRPSHHFTMETGWRLRSSHKMLNLLDSEFTTPEVWTSILKAFYENACVLSREPGNAGNASRTIQFGWLLYNTYYPEISQPGWWNTNLERQASNVRNTLFADGSNVEACSGYIRGTMLAMQESVDLVKNVRGILLPGAKPYGQLAEYYMNLTTPAGTLYNWGDGGRVNVREYVLAAGETLNNPHLIYVGSKGERGVEPPYFSRLYPVGKTFTMRTSWTDDNGLGAFINARTGGGHSHPDDLNLDIYAYGRRLLADPGPGSYNSSDPSANWQTRTSGHNTIVIDGGNQARVGKSEIAATANRVFDHVEAWTEAYGKQRVYRRVLFVRPSYWIVSDFIRADGAAHTYEQVWHPEEGAEPMIDPETQRIQSRFAVGGNVQLVPADPAEVRANIGDGWMEGRQAKYVWFKKSPMTGDTTFDTVIYPTPEGNETVVSVERLAVTGPDGALAATQATALKIAIGKERTGYYFQSYLEKPASVEFGGFTFDGETAYVELDQEGRVTYAVLRKGSGLKRAGKPLVEAGKPVESLGAHVEGETVRIETATDATDVVVACSATVKQALLNGKDMPFSRKDDTVRIDGR